VWGESNVFPIRRNISRITLAELSSPVEAVVASPDSWREDEWDALLASSSEMLDKMISETTSEYEARVSRKYEKSNSTLILKSTPNPSS